MLWIANESYLTSMGLSQPLLHPSIPVLPLTLHAVKASFQATPKDGVPESVLRIDGPGAFNSLPSLVRHSAERTEVACKPAVTFLAHLGLTEHKTDKTKRGDNSTLVSLCSLMNYLLYTHKYPVPMPIYRCSTSRCPLCQPPFLFAKYVPPIPSCEAYSGCSECCRDGLGWEQDAQCANSWYSGFQHTERFESLHRFPHSDVRAGSAAPCELPPGVL